MLKCQCVKSKHLKFQEENLNFEISRCKIQPLPNFKGVVGVKSPDYTMGLEPIVKFDHVREEGVDTKKAPGPILMSPNLFKRRSEEKCLLGRTKYGSNTHSASNKESLQRALVVGMSPTSP